MAQRKEDLQKFEELNALFLALDDESQDSALAILKSIEYAQAEMLEQNSAKPLCKLPV